MNTADRISPMAQSSLEGPLESEKNILLVSPTNLNGGDTV